MACSENTFRAYTQEQGKLYATDRPPYAPAFLKLIVDHHSSTGGQLGRVVDVGCGAGQATHDLSHYFSEAIGLDPSEGMINGARAASSASAGTSRSRARFAVSTAEDLGASLDPPIGENSVDLVTAATAAHWFDLDRFWARAAYVLKPGGTVALWARTGMSIDPSSTPNGDAIKAAMEAFYQQLLPYASSGGDMTRNLYVDLTLPWNLDSPIKTFDERSFFRKVWNQDRKFLQSTEDEDFGTATSMSPKEFAKFLGTHSPVTRWREAHRELAETKNDIVEVVRTKIEGLLHDVGVEPDKEVLGGGVALVLLMVKKI